MALTSAELYGSRVHASKGSTDYSVTLTYVIKGDSSDLAVMTHLETTSPTTYNSLPRYSIDVTPMHVNTLTPGENCWEGTVVYSDREAAEDALSVQVSFIVNRNDLPAIRRSFSLSTETQNVKKSLATVDSRYIYSPTPAPYAGYINLDDSGVQGVDIQVPIGTYTITVTMEVATFNSNKITWAQAIGKTNSVAYEGFAAGTLLFIGLDAQPWYQNDSGSVQEYYDVSFSFSYRQGASINNPIGSALAKQGWDYFWAHYYQTNPDEEGVPAVYEMDSAYIEQVYQEMTFVGLIPGL